jgi:hypothetical protein
VSTNRFLLRRPRSISGHPVSAEVLGAPRTLVFGTVFEALAAGLAPASHRNRGRGADDEPEIERF